jgi:23S rRNA (adenine2503-C2)-methyltransferase
MITAMQPVVGMELVDLQALLGPDEPAFRARQIYDAVYRRRVTDLAKISSLPSVFPSFFQAPGHARWRDQ